MKIANQIIFILFTTITLFSTLKNTGTLGYYILFTDNFVENFCENKSRPALECNGKCVLSKMLLQQASEDKEPLNIDFLRIETVLFLGTIFNIEFVVPGNTSYLNLGYHITYSFKLIAQITHPPQI
ncbi:MULTISPECIES: hypothetical protein [unclassified Cellulophaga]|uniref:hypothetical protein n=1 Tax=unclassified Cellulophaga TaxID=2634405 RepID=UPI001C4EAB4E|nr:hypothetical protein [Cellulophaga sp. HaHa_2_1]QXP52339.1 hypothetical protein H0I24_19830 [Cellulophaga sp. HaHa_2_1]